MAGFARAAATAMPRLIHARGGWLLTYDLVQWTQPLALQHLPEPGALLGVLYRVDRWLLHQRSTGELLLLTPPGDPWAFLVAECLEELLQEPMLSTRCLATLAALMMRPISMQKLFKHNAAPYSGFLQLKVAGPASEDPPLRFAICSSSPELLLSSSRGRLATCPIKGTCARSSNVEEDQHLRQQMVASQKEVAEHMMLVDLERHDLGHASLPSSVSWERWRVETFPNIQHMVSKVTGRLRPTSDLWTALEAIFPGGAIGPGSITGCPKTATIAAIDVLEGEPRRSWTGSLGFADLETGEGQWNILIRTLEAERSEANSWLAVVKAGGGLTIGSDPVSEVQEAKLKAERILEVAFGGRWSGATSRRQVKESSSSHVEVQEVSLSGAPSEVSARVDALLKAFREQGEAKARSCGTWSSWGPQHGDDFYGGRPVFYNAEKGKYLFFNRKHQRWQIFVRTSWKASARLYTKRAPHLASEELAWHVYTGGKFAAWPEEEAECFPVFSPELTDWKGSTTAVRVDPKRREADYSQGGWIDDAFPHTQESIGNSRQCEWVRARDLAEKPALFDDIEPADVCQGALGDCWLIAAIAGAAEFPNFFRDHLFETKEINEDGKYRIRLYDWIKKKWTVIEIDDYIPCKPRKWYEPVASTIFSEVCNEQLYVVLMEKAFAKFAGSYQALNGGFSFLAWMAMTGETDVIGWWRQRHQPKWESWISPE
eukprot:g10358.t1